MMEKGGGVEAFYVGVRQHLCPPRLTNKCPEITHVSGLARYKHFLSKISAFHKNAKRILGSLQNYIFYALSITSYYQICSNVVLPNLIDHFALSTLFDFKSVVIVEVPSH